MMGIYFEYQNNILSTLADLSFTPQYSVLFLPLTQEDPVEQ